MNDVRHKNAQLSGGNKRHTYISHVSTACMHHHRMGLNSSGLHFLDHRTLLGSSIAEYGYPRGLDAYSVLPMYIRYVQASMHAPRLPKPRVFCSLFLSFGDLGVRSSSVVYCGTVVQCTPPKKTRQTPKKNPPDADGGETRTCVWASVQAIIDQIKSNQILSHSYPSRGK